MKKILALVLALAMLFTLAACTGTPANEQPANTNAPADTNAPAAETNGAAENTGAGKKIGFVTFGLGGDFFQMLADEYKKVFTEAGWEADYADGQFDPNTQIQACENYIANGVDVLVIWAVAPEAMNNVIDQAMEKGIKVIAFVAETAKYDVLMVNDDAKMASNLAKLAAKWIDAEYADAPDHSVPVAVLSCRAAETGVLQADVLLKIEEFSTKAKFAMEVECSDETMTTGQTTAENLYTTNPEIKVFLTPHSGLGNGVNNFFTGISSPVTDYTGMGIFCINGDGSTAEAIQASLDGKAPMRGTVMTGSVHDTAMEIFDCVTGLLDGTYESGYVRSGANIFIYADTINEYLETGTVTSITEEDFQ